MKKRVAYTVLLSFMFWVGVYTGLNWQKHKITNRVYQRFGEGDMGLSLNHYLFTGDSTDIDFIEASEPNL